MFVVFLNAYKSRIPPHPLKHTFTPEDHHGPRQQIADGTRLVHHPSFRRRRAGGNRRGHREEPGKHLHHRQGELAQDGCERVCDVSRGRLLQEGGATRGGTQRPRT